MKNECALCHVVRETKIKRYGKFRGDVCSECQEEMNWTRTCIKISTDDLDKDFAALADTDYMR